MDQNATTELVFFVNGRKIIEPNVDPEWTLLYYLRNKLRLCGTKLGCAEGGCGACTVMVSKYDRNQDKIIHMAVNACLAPVSSMHGLAVTTVEGIGSIKTRLHSVQERIAKAHGSQCGFCTPGIVMSMYTLLRNKSKPNMDDIEVAFQGNLCRCTGYRPIIEGFKTFTEEWEQNRVNMTNGATNGVCALGSKCCKNLSNGCDEQSNEDEALFDANGFLPYDPSQEPIFPPELKVHAKLDTQYLVFKSERTTWYRPTSLERLLELKKNFPGARIIVGNTEVGVEVKFKNCNYPVLIQPNQIFQLSQIERNSCGLKVGAAITLNELENSLKVEISKEPEFRTQIFTAIVEMLHWFAGKQIRNVAAVGGNIMTSSPISDLNPIFLAANCEIELQSKDRGLRRVKMDQNFFTAYRRNIVNQDEVLMNILIPYTTKNQFFLAYKQAKRRDDDIAIVNSAFNVKLKPGSSIIEDITLAFGGMAPTTIVASKTRQKLIGRNWCDDILEDAYATLLKDMPISPDAPGGMTQYRSCLTLSLFFKAYLTILSKMEKELTQTTDIPASYKSAINGFHTEIPHSSQLYQKVSTDQNVFDPVGRPLVHKSAYKQATGEAIYCDDMPKMEGELYLALVYSTKTHARILSINESKALQVKGVHAFFSAKDLPSKKNSWGPIVHDEEIFASEKVYFQGQVIGAIVADDQIIAQRAAKLVEVQYEDLSPIIITIEDAIKHSSYFPGCPKILVNGNSEEAFHNADHILSGEVRMGGQEHFYLETHCSIVIPKKEDNELEIYSSCQHPTEMQTLVGKMLDIPYNRIVCKVKRLGGGFGGKESRSSMIALPVALAAYKLNRPIRCMLDRDEDMVISGQRHPFHGKYRFSFTKEGKITGCEIEIYSNCGHSLDLSQAVLERAMFHFQNAYKIPNVKVLGYLCKTNLQSNTAFRGFGGPQGMFFAENMIRDIAHFLGKDPIKIAEINLYREGDKTHYNQAIDGRAVQRCWNECIAQSKLEERKKEIEHFNRQNRWKKRGIAMVPTMFGISFTFKTLNQAGALIMIYTDGSVLLTHGGTEMGQGLHTKMIQVASRALGIPESYIHISETSTDKVPNTSATAASASSDLNGMAIVDACKKIIERLKPIIAENPNGKWEDWIQKAYMERISLSATGFYRTPGIGYNWEKNEGNPFHYFTYGAACSEVEIDCLTGDHKVLRTDIVMDLGDSLNPAIDIGQIEGGFMQGYGLFTLEELVVSSRGMLFSRGPGTYKLPGFADIPIEFNVQLLKNAANPRAVYSSKAVGEPPLFLAASVFFAIKEAIRSARQDADIKEWFRIDSPATCARIRMACIDNIVNKIPQADPATYTPWNVIP